MSSRRNQYKKWEMFADVFNDMKMSGDLCKDKQRLAGRYTALIVKAKKEKNPVKRKVFEEVAKIIKSMIN